MTNILLGDVLSIRTEIHLADKSSRCRVSTQKILLCSAVSLLCAFVCDNVTRVQFNEELYINKI